MEEKYVGYLKYSGKSVEHGFLDARKSAEALIGFDEVLRHFVSAENPDFREIDYEIPVRVKKGTWGIWIPVGIGAIVTTYYLSSVAKKAGSDGFFETGPAKDIDKVFRGALVSAQWTLKIGIHLGNFAKKEFKNTVKIKQKGDSPVIEIPNDQGELLEVPKKYFDIYVKCPENLFSKNAELINHERSLEMGVFKQDNNEEKISITQKDRQIFYKAKDEDSGVLFPELKHGQNVSLEGAITRGNEKTNTLGFEYKGHIITCRPIDRNIAGYKNKIVSPERGHLFPKVKIHGVVDRTDEHGGFKEKRPVIIFSDIELLSSKADIGPRLF